MKKKYLYMMAITAIAELFNCCQGNFVLQAQSVIINLSEWDFIHSEKLSFFADSIEYVSLETSKNSLIGQSKIVHLSDERIFVVRGDSILIFNRQGHFIKRFSREGINGCTLDNENKRLLLYNSYRRGIEIYDFDGNHIRFINDSRGSVVHTREISVFKNHVILNNENLTPNFFSAYRLDKNHFHVSNADYSYSNTYSVKPQKPIRMFDAYCVGFQNKDSVFLFKEMFCDTLYSTKDFQSFSPKYVFQLGSKKADYETNMKIRSLEIPVNPLSFEDDRYRIWSFLEVSNFLFLKVVTFRAGNFEGHLCLYDSRLKQTKMYDSEVLINDIDGGADFNPFGSRVENQHVYCDKIYTLIYPADLKEAQSKHKTYSSVQQRKKLEELTNSLLDDDNPVLMIVKMKK
jgi:hypothetical protein